MLAASIAVNAPLVQEGGCSDPYTKRRKTDLGGFLTAFPFVGSPPSLSDRSGSESAGVSRAPSVAGQGGAGGASGAAGAFQAAFPAVGSPGSDSVSGQEGACDSKSNVMQSENNEDSGSERCSTSPCGGGPPKKVDRKMKHKFVEQNRRRKKTELIDVLQDVVGVNPFAKKSSKSQSKVNMILEATLDFLQRGDVIEVRQRAAKRQRESPEEADDAPNTRISTAVTMAADRPAAALAVNLTVPAPRNFTSGQFGGAFDTAPMAMVMSTPQGNVLRCNRLAYNLFGVEAAETPTIFNVTAPVSLPDTLRAISQLLSGQARKIKMLKRCGVKSGATPQFQTEMNCIHKYGKPQFFVCYLKEVPEDKPKAKQLLGGAHAQAKSRFEEVGAEPRPEEEEWFVPDRRTEDDKKVSTFVTPAYQWNFGRFVDVPLAYVKIPIVEEDIDDPEMDEIFRAIDRHAKERDSEYQRLHGMH